MTSSKILFYLCISFIAGIFLESLVDVPQTFLWGFLILAVFLILAEFIMPQNLLRNLLRNKLRTQNYFLIIGFCILFFMIGILKFQISEFNILNDELSKLNEAGKITLTGIIIDEPDLKDSSQTLKVKTDNFNSTVLVTTSRYPEYNYLDKVEVMGKLQTPMETEDFSYKNYLLKDHIYSVMYFPGIKIVRKIQGSPSSIVYSTILWVKGKLRDSIRTNFLPPSSSILEGVILGNKSAVSQDLKDKFRITGLSHIIAVSGMHIVILSSIVMYFLLLLGLWRNQAFYGAVTFILIYVALVGLPSSAIRAGIMGMIYLLGQKLGRQTMSSRIIVLAGILMLLFNPLLLFYDIGFQLSFLAVLGLIYFEPLVRNFIKFLLNKFLRLNLQKKYENLLMLFSVTLAAQIFTLPIIIYNFGNISFISPLTNMLILPVIYYVMLFGFLSSLIGTIWGSLGWLLSLPCYFLLSYVFWIIDIFSKPWAYKIVSNVSWIWIFVFYLISGVAIWFLNKKYSQKFL
jgi:competence protein ComEC